MGEVWLARDEALGRRVALKLLPEDLTRDPLRVSRFEQEARAASALNHPNVCHIYALGTTGTGQRYIAMELVEGQTLRAKLRQVRLSVREALSVANQVAGALTAAHGLGIVHRDLKPENVMLRPDGLVKVLDFGLAKLAPVLPELAGADSTHTFLHTDPGSVVGTVAYMSPEQARGQEVDARTDVWSLGVVLYEMVAGRRPFTGPSSSDVLAAILERAPEPLARFEADVPPGLQRIVSKALRKDADQRYQTIRDLKLDLQALFDDLTTPATSSGTPASSPEPVPSGNLSHPESSAEYLVRQAARHKMIAAGVIAAMLIVASAVLWRTAFVRPATQRPPRDPSFQQLTANVSELSLSDVIMSPDGRYVAYTDPTGIHVRIVETAETQRLPRTKGMRLYGWSRDSTRVRAADCQGDTCVGWSISLVGDSRYRADGSWPVGEPTFALPNVPGLLRFVPEHSDIGSAGQILAFELRYDLLDGSPARVLAKRVSLASGSSTEPRVLFATSEGTTLKSVPLEGGTPVTLWRAARGWHIDEFVALPGHRIIAAISAGAGRALYELRADPSGPDTRVPRRLTDWGPDVMWSLSASGDGTRVVFLKRRWQSDVYVADLNVQRTSLSPPTRLTLDERTDTVTAWTPDSKSVLFYSARTGNADIFRQEIIDESPEPVAVGPGDQWYVRVSGDGHWLLYNETLADGTTRLMRAPVSGGIGQPVCPP